MAEVKSEENWKREIGAHKGGDGPVSWHKYVESIDEAETAECNNDNPGSPGLRPMVPGYLRSSSLVIIRFAESKVYTALADVIAEQCASG